MSTYTRMQADAVKKIAFNAGIMVSGDGFDPATGVVTDSKMIGATSGGWSFTPNLAFTDLGEDVDQAKNGTMQFNKYTGCEPHATGTLIQVGNDNILQIVPGGVAEAVEAGTPAEEVDGLTKIVPTRAMSYMDLWLITDYGTITGVEGGSAGGFFAILLKNALNVNGAQPTTTKDGKMQLPVDFRAFYDADKQDEEPYEIYIKTPPAA